MKWEYTIVALEPDHGEPRDDQLNNYGRLHWELITVQKEGDRFIGYFKRRLGQISVVDNQTSVARG